MGGAILVVDDDTSIRETLREFLAAQGYEVRSAGDGAWALDVIRRGFVPDLILLDLMMPVMSGWEFLLEAEEDPLLRRIPIVVVSAMPAPVAEPGSEGGVKACVTKPFQLDEVLGLIARWGGGPASVPPQPAPS